MKKLFYFISLIATIFSIISLFIFPLYDLDKDTLENTIIPSFSETEILNTTKLIELKTYDEGLYLTDITSLLVSYITYNHNLYQNLKEATTLEFIPRITNLFSIWANPIILILFLLIYLIVLFILTIILIKNIISLIFNINLKAGFATFICLFMVLCLLNINYLIPTSFYSKVTNQGTINTLNIIKSLTKSKGLDYITGSLIISLWVNLMVKLVKVKPKLKKDYRYNEQ